MTTLNIPLLILIFSMIQSTSCQVGWKTVSINIFTNDYNQIPFHTFHQKQLNECNVKSVAIISDGSCFLQNVAVEFFRHLEIPLFQREENLYSTNRSDMNEGFKQWLRKVYFKRSVNLFIVLVKTPRLVLETVESVFVSDQRGELAVLPHNTLWEVVAWTRDQLEEVKEQQRHSVLDNVAVVHVRLTNRTPLFPLNPSNEIEVFSLSTFIWGENRTRYPAPVIWRNVTESNNKKNNKNGCRLFPNTRYNLNGRRLKVLVNTDLGGLLEVGNSSGIIVHGFLARVLKATEYVLNFTSELMTVEHTPNEDFFDRWERYRDVVVRGDIDIGLSPWSIAYSQTDNFTQSYPILFGNIVGVYRLPRKTHLFDSLFLLCPFPRLVYLMLLMTLTLLSVVYTVIVHVCYESETSKKPRQKSVICQAERPSNLNDESRLRSSFSLSFVLKYFRILSLFSSAILNQAYLPRPLQTSSRLVIGMWALGLVFFYAMYSSFITVDMIKRKQEVPFQTFHQLIQNDFSFFSIRGGVVDTAMNETINVSDTVTRLKTRMDYVTFTGSPCDFIDRTMSSLADKTVFIYHNDYIQRWIYRNAKEFEYVVMKDDPLIASDIAIIFPQKSDLENLISQSIVRLFETGIHENILNDWLGSKNDPVEEGNVARLESRRKVIAIEDTLWLCIVCMFGVVFSALILGIEIIMKLIKRIRVAETDVNHEQNFWSDGKSDPRIVV